MDSQLTNRIWSEPPEPPAPGPHPPSPCRPHDPDVGHQHPRTSPAARTTSPHHPGPPPRRARNPPRPPPIAPRHRTSQQRRGRVGEDGGRRRPSIGQQSPAPSGSPASMRPHKELHAQMPAAPVTGAAGLRRQQPRGTTRGRELGKRGGSGGGLGFCPPGRPRGGDVRGLVGGSPEALLDGATLVPIQRKIGSLTVSSQDEARGREVAEARRQGGKAATTRRHGGTAATTLGGGVSDDAGRGCWAALDSMGGDEEVSEERCGHDEECRVCREYVKSFL
jgi:hypothetical protein